MAKKTKNIVDYIAPLNMNGLRGRMLYMPASKSRKREILFVYGHHSSLERWWGLTQNLNRYGGVTMPDLPGFGGMDSFYKIGQQATIDNMADYLAAFVKMRYKRRRFTIVGMSFGFVVATRMLQRYPDLAKRVDLLISIAGFMHKGDFAFSKARWTFYRYVAGLFSLPVTSAFFKYTALNPRLIRLAYRHTHNAKKKFKGVVDEELQEMLNVEVDLWRSNDVRTYMKTTVEFLTLDNCLHKVELPVHHVAVAADQYFQSDAVEQHMRVVFKDFNLLSTLNVGKHAPSVIADAKSTAPFVPQKLRQLLNKQP